MAKWLILVAGIFLFMTGMGSETYSFANPVRHCFNLGLIRFYSCSGSAAWPLTVTWGITLIGVALMAWSFIYSRRAAARSAR